MSNHSQYSKLEAGLSSTGKGGGEKGEYDEPEQRRIYDMCMVFKYKTSKGVAYEDPNELVVSRRSNTASPEEIKQMDHWKEQRNSILKSLQNCGLQVFCYYSRDRDEVLVKIGAGAQKLRDTAHRCKYKLQLKKQFLNAYAEYRHDFPGRPERGYRDRRVVSHIYKTHTENDLPDSDAIFRTLDKIYLIHHIITSQDKDCAGIKVEALLHKRDLKAYFPLHEDGAIRDLRGERPDERLWKWFWLGEEHANKVRDYFGDKIAFYFLFMGFYWKWLVPLAGVGLLLQFIDWIARTPDNITAIPFCILMSVWSIFLPYFWRRQEAKYAIGWGTLDLVDTLESCRTAHRGEMRINPVTAQVEPYYPAEFRKRQYVKSWALTVVLGGFLIFFVLTLLYWRHEYRDSISGGVFGWEVITAAYVEGSNFLLTVLSRKLTELENHRTQTEHDTHLLAKVMGFKFVNSYFALYYIAFFKAHTYLFGVPMKCTRGDCFVDLQRQLFVFVLFRLTVSNFVQWMYPKFVAWFNSVYFDRKSCQSYMYGHSLLELADMSPAEVQAKRPRHDAFSDFDEVLITHGFSTLFAVTSPWVCTAALGATLVKIYLDMNNLISSRQRPIPTKARNNEPWTTAFELYGFFAASTNIVLLIFASEQYDSWSLTEKLTLFVYLEHTIFLARLVLKVVFPAVPRNVELLQLKQANMVHRCLEDIKVEQHQDFSMFRDNKGEQIEIFEHDYLDDDNDDPEPTLSLRDSASTMRDGIMEITQQHKKKGARWSGS